MSGNGGTSKLARRRFLHLAIGATALGLTGRLGSGSTASAAPLLARSVAPATAGAYDGLTYLLGDLHAHSRVSGDASDGEDTADFFYQARTGGLLDFGAITDHVESNWWGPRGYCETGIGTSCGGNWDTLKQAVSTNYVPNDGSTVGPYFTTILGYEYTSGVEVGVAPRPGLGHRTVLFKGESPDLQVPSCSDWPDGLPGGWDGPCADGTWVQDVTRLWTRLDGWRSQNPSQRDFLSITHHPYGGAQAYHFDVPSSQIATYQPLFEIYSKWGSSEVKLNQDFADLRGTYCVPINHDESPLRTAREVLLQSLTDLNFRVGFVGGTDSHTTPGPRKGGSGYRKPQPPSGQLGLTRFYKGGWTGVWATRNTRTAIWEALQARRCYATTGVRMELRFVLAPEREAAALPMGAGWNGSIELPSAEFKNGVSFRVSADVRPASPVTKIKRIELIRVRAGMTGSAERVYLADNLNHLSFDTGISVDASSAAYPGQDLAYYVRVTCSNDGLADDWAWPNAAATSKWNELAWSSPIWVKLT